MKVLWFSNSPANADEYYNYELKKTGGWLKSLDKALQNKVDLYVAFYKNYEHDPFKYKSTTYYPVSMFKSKFHKLYHKIFKCVIDKKDLYEYLKIIEDVNPDIIHIHGTENPFGCIINNTEIPVVVSIQGNITVYHHKYFSGIEKKFIKRFFPYYRNVIDLLYQRSFYNRYLEFTKMKKIEIRNLKDCNHIIGRTRWDYRISRVLAPNSNYYHVDEILRDEFYKNKWKNPNYKTIKLFTTNQSNLYKGFETICYSISLLNKIGINFKWYVAGIEQNDLIVKIVKRKLEQIYPSRNLVLVGKLNANEIVHHLLETNIYIMPSHIENSPNNLCEAMILGLPCIATYAGGTGSLLDDGKDGILIQDGDPWVMTGAIIELLNDKEKCIQYGNNARKRALKRHNKEIVVNSLLNIYSKILNK